MTEPIQTPVAPPRRRRRFLRASLVLLLLLAILFWFTPAVIARTELRHRIVDSALKDFNGTIRSGGASMSWFGTVEFTDVTLTEPSGRVAVTAPRVTTSKTLWELAWNRDDLGTFHIHEPDAIMSVENGKTNIEEWIANYTKDDGTPPKPERLAFAIEASNGKATLKGNPDTRIQNVTFAYRSPKSRTEPQEIHLAADAPAGGKLDATVLLGTDTGVTLTAAAFPLGALGPVLPRFTTGTSAEGSLTADVRGKWNIPADKPMSVELSGSANVADLALRAPWLGGETLSMKTVALLKSEIATDEAGRIDVKSLKVLCDVGDASVSGLFDPAFDSARLSKQAGVEITANVDLAKLARRLPKLLHIRGDTVIQHASVGLTLKSEASATGTIWVGDVATRDIVAKRGGESLTWQSPLQGSFRGRLRDDGLPVFEDLKVLSEFISIAARGQPEAFSIGARFDLGKLTAKLDRFVKLDAYTMVGEGTIQLNAKPVPNADTTDVRGNIDFTKLEIRDAGKVLLAEPELHVSLDCVGKLLTGSKVRIDAGRFDLVTDARRPELDRVSVALREPIADAVALSSGRADVRLDGEMRAWKARFDRIEPLIDKFSQKKAISDPLVLPAPPDRGFKDWDIAGRGSISATVIVSVDRFVGEKIHLDLKSVKVISPPRSLHSINFDDPKLEIAATATFDRKTKSIALTDVQCWSQNIGVSTPRIDLVRDAKLGDRLTAALTIHAVVLEPTQRTFRLQETPADAIRGVAKGTATVSASAARIEFDTDLKIDNFSFGPAADPTWAEPLIALKGGGSFDFDADALQLKSTTVSRDGFAAEVRGSVGKLSTEMDLNLAGNLTYDLAKIEPKLKEYLGKGGRATGQGTKPFAISGNLANGGQNLAVRVGDGPKKNLDQLKGNAAVGWKSLKAYGFDVGEAELKANVDKGLVKINRVDAKFGSGTVRLEPTIALNPGAYDLSFTKGTVVEKAKLSPAACADAIGYALPAIANVAQAEGTISFELGDNRIPLVAPAKGTMVGTLLIHEAEVSPGPLVSKIAGLFSASALKLQLTKDQRVPIEMKDGRVHHRDFAITVDGYTVKTSGSVGVDGTLALILEVPLTGKVAAALVPGDQPRVRDALAKQTVRIAITGTLAKPQLDEGLFRKIVGDTVKGAMKDLVKDAAAESILKGLEKFLPKK